MTRENDLVGSAGAVNFRKLCCWWLHRRQWTIVTPGVLPFGLDSERFCPVCNKMRGHPARVPALRLAPAMA